MERAGRYRGVYADTTRSDLEQKIQAFLKLAAQYPTTKEISGFLLTTLAYTWSPLADKWTSDYGFPIIHIPFAANPDEFDARGRKRQERADCDVFLNWDTNPEKYELRQEVTASLSAPGLQQETGLRVKMPTVFLSHEDYMDNLANCKFHVSTIGMPGRFNLVGTRYFEVFASGTGLLFSQKPCETSASAYEALHIDDNITVFFSSSEELVEKLVYFKQHPKEADVLIENARLWSSRNTWSERARRVSQQVLQAMCNG